MALYTYSSFPKATNLSREAGFPLTLTLSPIGERGCEWNYFNDPVTNGKERLNTAINKP
jgi:hypothetical protein